jgi:hypothetical protein
MAVRYAAQAWFPFGRTRFMRGSDCSRLIPKALALRCFLVHAAEAVQLSKPAQRALSRVAQWRSNQVSGASLPKMGIFAVAAGDFRHISLGFCEFGASCASWHAPVSGFRSAHFQNHVEPLPTIASSSQTRPSPKRGEISNVARFGRWNRPRPSHRRFIAIGF